MMSILNEKECADTEILIFTFTLINKTLAGISDQDTYYDMIDSLEEQGMEKIIKSIMSKKGIEKDLMKQLQIYELVLKHEDEGPATDGGDDQGIKLSDQHANHSLLFELPLEPGAAVTTRGRSRASKSSERRRSRRHSSVGHSLISSAAAGGNKIKTLSFVPPPKNTKVIEDLVPNWQKKALESTQQYSSSSVNNGNFTTSKMLQEVNNNINSNNNLSNNNNKSEGAVIKIKEVPPVKSSPPPQVAVKPTTMGTTISTEETIVPLKRDFRPSSKDGGDLLYNSFSGQRASISSTSSADSYGSSTSSGAYSMVSSTPSSADSRGGGGLGGQKSPSFEKSLAANTKSSLIEKRKRILFEQQQNNSSNGKLCLPSNETSKRNSTIDVQSSANGTQFSMSQFSNSSECIDTSKSYLLSKMYENNHESKVIGNGTKVPSNSNKLSWEPVNDTTSKVDKSSIPGSSIGVKNIQEKIMRTGAPGNDHLINGHGVSSNIRDVIRNPNEFLHLHKTSSSPIRRPSPSSRRPFRPLKLNDLDFTDLKPEDDQDILNGTTTVNGLNGDCGQDGSPGSPVIPCPPPLPSMMNNQFQPPIPPPPPPLPGITCPLGSLSPSILQSSTPPHIQLNNHVINYNNSNNNNNSHDSIKNNYNQTMTWLKSSAAGPHQLNGSNEMDNSTMSSWSVVDGHMTGVRGCINPPPPNSNFHPGSMYHGTLKNKKTVKLFWKEVKEEKSILNRLKKKKTIWDEITMIPVDPVKMEHLFENRTKELVNKVRLSPFFLPSFLFPSIITLSCTHQTWRGNPLIIDSLTDSFRVVHKSLAVDQ